MGELGLIYNRQRIATCIPLEYTQVAAIKKNHFNDCFADIVKTEESTKNNFIQRYILNSSDTSDYLGRFGIMFKRVVHSKGDILVEEKIPAKNIWLIFSGEISLKKSWVSSAPSDNILKKSHSEKYWHQLCVLGKGEIIGDDQIFEDNHIFDYRAEVKSECVLYVLEINKVRENLNSNPLLRNQFITKIQRKLRFLKGLALNFSLVISAKRQKDSILTMKKLERKISHFGSKILGDTDSSYFFNKNYIHRRPRNMSIPNTNTTSSFIIKENPSFQKKEPQSKDSENGRFRVFEILKCRSKESRFKAKSKSLKSFSMTNLKKTKSIDFIKSMMASAFSNSTHSKVNKNGAKAKRRKRMPYLQLTRLTTDNTK